LPRRRRLKAQVLPLPHGPKNKTLSFVSASLLFFLGLANSLYDNSINKMVTTAATTWCHSIVFMRLAARRSHFFNSGCGGVAVEVAAPWYTSMSGSVCVYKG
jgi:hypothetical protein